MRFMMLVIPPGYEKAAPGTLPEAGDVETMMKFNMAMHEAGVLISAEGLHPPSMGARVAFTGKIATVTDGPHIETKEVVGGFWMIDVKSKEEAIEWARRAPMPANETIEIRQIMEIEDFPADAQETGARFAELQTPGKH